MVLYQVLFHYFDRFLMEYESRFEREYRLCSPQARTNEGVFFRPIVKEVVEKYLDCGNPKCGFALMIRYRLMSAGVFHKIPRIDDSRLAEIFAREVLAMLVCKELLSSEWAERILSWPHSGFNVHSLVLAKTKIEAERVGKYMLRPILALDRLTFLEPEGKVGYRYGEKGAEQETMDYLEFIARVTSHIPDKGQVMVRYYGLYANAHIY